MRDGKFLGAARAGLALCFCIFTAACSGSVNSIQSGQPTDLSNKPPVECPSPEPALANTKIYYVAANESGASDTACDGSAPSNLGSGHCPFKSLLSNNSKYILVNAKNTRIEMRAGTYKTGTALDEHFTLQGAGANEHERLVLSTYKNEKVTIDGENVQREMVSLSGDYTTVEKIIFKNAGAHNVIVNSGSHHKVQCNLLLKNFASDSMKGAPHTNHVLVRNNEFTDWDSQAIDLTQVNDWTITENYFHDSRAPRGQPLGTKMGTTNVKFTKNLIVNTAGLSFGGTASFGTKPHPEEYEALDLLAEDNVFKDIRENTGVVKFYSCSNCIFRKNDIIDATGGIVLGGPQFESGDQSTCANDSINCKATSGAIISDNRFKKLDGDGVFPNLYIFAYATEMNGLLSEKNLYCRSSENNGQFMIDNVSMNQGAWISASSTDNDSQIVLESDSRCSF